MAYSGGRTILTSEWQQQPRGTSAGPSWMLVYRLGSSRLGQSVAMLLWVLQLLPFGSKLPGICSPKEGNWMGQLEAFGTLPPGATTLAICSMPPTAPSRKSTSSSTHVGTAAAPSTPGCAHSPQNQPDHTQFCSDGWLL